MSRRIAAAGLAFVLTAALRFLNSATAFEGGFPQIRPLDDLYHLKRMTYSAAHFPRVLEFDKDRGVKGAYCPWPPLYDLASGGLARVFGSTAMIDVLAIVVWIPPLLTAAFVAMFMFALWPRAPLAAIVTTMAIALSPSPLVDSWIGSIDHHFLEPPLVFAILGAVALVLMSARERELRAGITLGVAMTPAMFVQPALLLGCGVAFAVVFFANRTRAAMVAFALPAGVIALFRLTRDAAMPDNPWFLGWPHAAIFFGAFVAALIAWRIDAKTIGARFVALAAGAIATLLVPGALRGITGGAQFLGGDVWLSRIKEFQPIWTLSGRPLWIYATCLIAGAVLTVPLLLRGIRTKHAVMIAIAGFAMLYLALAMTSLRFTSIATCVLALAGGFFAEAWWRDGKRNAAIAIALFVVVPAALNLILFVRMGMPHPLTGMSAPMQVAGFLRRENPARERALAPWMWGHAFDVIGDTPVILDNFGTMPSAEEFRRAHEVLLTSNENELASYCRAAGVRFVVLTRPPVAIVDAGLTIGVPLETFVRNNALTERTTSTWWWRAWNQFPTPTNHFHPAFETRDGSVRVWRLVDDPPRQR
ncbi:MAG TPA: hypothetical protein VF608_11425 [Thermoanaerobaculia bacterium]